MEYIRTSEKPPAKFTFPFAYRPHPLLLEAKCRVEDNLPLFEQQGRMIGLLLVQNTRLELGFLTSIEGMEMQAPSLPLVPLLIDSNAWGKMVNQEKQTERQIIVFQHSNEFLQAQADFEKRKREAAVIIAAAREAKHQARMQRKQKRAEAENWEDTDREQLFAQLKCESIADDKKHKTLKEKLDEELKISRERLQVYEEKLADLKRQKQNSVNKRWNSCELLNARMEAKSLKELFTDTPVPPGVEACNLPRLLNFAYKHDLKPLGFAQFWWGASPKNQIRKHNFFYPACSGKCKPLLQHMLQRLDVEPDPLLAGTATDSKINLIYEDEQLAVIEKPAGLLSIPAAEIRDSVLSRLQNRYPEATGPLLAHRLDKMTSGLMLISKSLKTHRALQQQFVDKSIHKTYIALLDGKIDNHSGSIDLPIAVEKYNRPMHQVCYKRGRAALTIWERIKEIKGRSLVEFKPQTGRTHQLRIHASHPDGLNCPIVGDKLYGQSAGRLMLHASSVTFTHPLTLRIMHFMSEPPFL